MKLLHNCTITCFCKELEDIEPIRTCIESFLPEDLEKEKIELVEEHLRIEEGENLISLKVHTTKDRHNNFVLEKLHELFSKEQQQKILLEDDRVDEKGMLYIRLDKTKLVEDNIAELVDHGNCIHFKLLLAAYPKNKEKALLIRDQLFSQKKL